MTADGELNGRRALVTGGTKGVGESKAPLVGGAS
jgi:NAD(P)-dependent dehydrogenase (short-subunit alcohol dehydrogenase family)